MHLYTNAELVTSVQFALRAVRAEPGQLLGSLSGTAAGEVRRVSERAITHRIAVHLEPLFPNHAVDCEYNRNLNEPKLVNVEFARLLERHRQRIIDKKVNEGARREDAQRLAEVELESFPDIIVHRRLSNEANLLVIEVKCYNDSRGSAGSEFDKAKLCAFTSLDQYKYQLGVFVLMRRDRDEIRCFERGAATVLEQEG